MIYTNGLKYCCYLILTGVLVDYKEQIFIIEKKTNI